MGTQPKLLHLQCNLYMQGLEKIIGEGEKDG